MTKRQFGELELTILNIIKSHKVMTVREVLTKLGHTNKYTTIMTVMNRLCQKNQLTRTKVGTYYEYQLKEAEVPSIMSAWKKKIFGVKTSEMISYLIQSSDDITPQELLELEKMIEEAKQKRI